MSLKLLSYVNESKWAILPGALEAIVELVQDHSLQFPKETFHQEDGEMQAVIGTVGERIEGTRFSALSGNVGILHVDGPIIPRSVNSISSGPSASLDLFGKELIAMDENPDVHNIITSFDSPGGMVTGVEEFGKLVRSLKTPVTAFVYGYAASAAYWMASQADEIVMAETAEVGSIGTVAVFEDRRAADEKKGIKRFEVVSNFSKKKRLDPTEGEGKENLIEILDDITLLFASDVAKGRGVTTEEVFQKFGEGRMFIAAKAIERGMADRTGTLIGLVEELNASNESNNINLLTAEDSMDLSKVSAEDFKQGNPSAYNEIVSAGAKAEQERLKSIEALSATDASVTSFVNEKKFDADMTKEKMALAIFESREDINKNAMESIKKSGEGLAKKTEEIATHTEDTSGKAATEDDEGLDFGAIEEGAANEHQSVYGTEPSTGE